jgi:hypothetical protein
MIDLSSNSTGGAYIIFKPTLNGWTLNKDTEVTLDHVVFDPETIKAGWGKMATGQAPEWIWDNPPERKGPLPSEEKDKEGKPVWKRGFHVSFFAKGIGLVTWSSTGAGPFDGFRACYEQIAKQLAANPGAVPVLKYTGSTPVKKGLGNTRVPNFNLVKWVPRDSIPWDKAPDAAAAPAPAPKPAPTAVDDDISFN